MANGKLGTAAAVALVLSVAGGGVYYTAAGPTGWMAPEVRISPSTATDSMMRIDKDRRVQMTGVPLSSLVAHASSIFPTRVIVRAALPEQRYDVTTRGSFGDNSEMESVFRKQLEKQFGITFHRDRQTTDVYYLTAPSGRGAGLKDSASGGRMGGMPGRIQAKRGDMKFLANCLEGATRRAVIDKTGLSGTYSFDLRWHAKKPESLFTSLKKQLGMELVPAQDQVDVVVIDEVVKR